MWHDARCEKPSGQGYLTTLGIKPSAPSSGVAHFCLLPAHMQSLATLTQGMVPYMARDGPGLAGTVCVPTPTTPRWWKGTEAG